MGNHHYNDEILLGLGEIASMDQGGGFLSISERRLIKRISIGISNHQYFFISKGDREKISDIINYLMEEVCDWKN